ncbi:prenyltransferase/squalene oxidase repeat-containing protein [Anaerobacillus sp. 1_MG-2023]|uniref:terpene cyclase/mutase family protein n=1 Tax=Bacillales TaxID=1385 RepID=UPI0026E3E81A|nr:prenyltransferase/squalene oxidase repeat-containing protein [Anaerobacillus sp. 1_MG-2023]MDO6658043.1 prenyltransferase/squalene oxidase repeat-containing protein [Anaerobacillus sp. 1_MG-2023]
MDMKRVNERIDELVKEAVSHQEKNGSFHYCFENSLLTDAVMIVLIRTLGLKEETLVDQLVHRLLMNQSRGGYWKLFEDDEGNLSATVQAYHSLLYSGKIEREHTQMKKAELYIRKWGGIEKTDSMTKVFLALNGHLEWPQLFHFPMLFMLIPGSFPVSFFDLSSYARLHFAPIILCQDLRYSIKTSWTPDLAHLLNEERVFSDAIKSFWDSIVQFPDNQLFKARKRAEQYMLQRIESDGTLLNYATATFFMIYAMLALGYEKQSPVILRAIDGLKGMLCLSENHIQNSPSTIWDTALITHTLQEAGLSSVDPIIMKASEYLGRNQHTKFGDWAMAKQNIIPGGWGFSEGNSIHPDVDDTTAALRAMKHASSSYSWQRGVNWILAMQNKDGGWPAFETDRKALLLKELPIDGAQSSFPDDSSADLTGRTVEFLCNFAGLQHNHPSVVRGVKWLVSNQESDGSWCGRWGICYVYGTWAAVTGLKAAGYSSSFPAISKGLEFLKKIQQEDGGWGESCKSDEQKKYISLSYSTPSQTAWAVDALTICGDKCDALHKGVEYLTKGAFENKELTYPTGAGLPGGFYVHYHSYKMIWPLLALAHYRQLLNQE